MANKARKTTNSNDSRVRNPGIRDSERTKELIIKQATREFSSKGFDGARVDNIAARCKLSKNSLYYHFKSKDGLITAVLERMYENLRFRQDVLTSSDDPIADMEKIVEHTLQAFIEFPEIIRLLNEENLHKAVHVKKSKVIRRLYEPLLDKIAAVIKQGQDSRAFRTDLDPVLIYLTLSSMAYHFISNSYTLEIALNRPLSTPDALTRWVAHIRDVIITYCKKPADVNSRAEQRLTMVG